jgi:hypothetical protein
LAGKERWSCEYIEPGPFNSPGKWPEIQVHTSRDQVGHGLRAALIRDLHKTDPNGFHELLGDDVFTE